MDGTVIKLRLMADYVEWPIWGPRGGPLRQGDLPLSEDLVSRIIQWLNAHKGPEFQPQWQPSSERLSDDEDEEEWVEEGRQIREQIARELGPKFQVTYVT